MNQNGEWQKLEVNGVLHWETITVHCDCDHGYCETRLYWNPSTNELVAAKDGSGVLNNRIPIVLPPSYALCKWVERTDDER